MIRVTGGSLKGRRLRTTRAAEMRPTTELNRRAIFDILGDAVLGTEVLDLFAGAGTLGIEALSRGAKHATFIERDRYACAVIAANLDATGLRRSSTIRRAEVAHHLRRKAPQQADLVFLDPPYAAGLASVGRILRMLAVGGWVRRGGTVVMEAEVGPVGWPSGFREIRVRRSGRTQITVAVQDEEQDDGDLPGDV